MSLTRFILSTLFFSFSILLVAQQNSASLTKNEQYKLAQQIIKNKIKVSPKKLSKLMNQTHDTAIAPASPSAIYRDSLYDDVPVLSSNESESEVFAAMNPLDTNNVIVAGMRVSASGLSFVVYRTLDGGNTWLQSPFEGFEGTNNLLGGGDPVLLFNQEGKAIFSWIALTPSQDFTTLFVKIHTATSLDGGFGWQMDTQVIDEADFTFLAIDRFVDKQWLAVDNEESSPFFGNQYVAYTEIMFSDTSYHIQVKTRMPDSISFSSEMIDVSGDAFSFVQYPSIDVDREGNIHLLFVGQLVSDGTVAMFYVQSSDGGHTFSSPSIIHAISLECFPRIGEEISCPNEGIDGVDDMRLYPCPHLRVDKSTGENDGNIYVTWTAHGLDTLETDGTEVYFTKSDNSGNTWTSPLKISDATENSLDDFFSMIEVNKDGIINICWYDRAEQGNRFLTTYQSRISMDGGTSFEDAKVLTSEASDFSFIGNQNNGFGIGEYNETVSTSNYFIPFWADGRTNDGNVDIYMAKIPLKKDSINVGWKEISTISTLFSVKEPHPNPTDNIINLQLTLNKKSSLQIGLYSIKGELIQEFVPITNYTTGNFDFSWSVSSLPTGTYILKIQTDFGFKSSTLILMK